MSISRQKKPSSLWMRSVSFAGLLQIINLVKEYPNGLTAKNLNEEIIKRRIPLKRDASEPSLTTLYHYRNTLLHLGILKRAKRSWHMKVDEDNPHVRILLDHIELNLEVKKAFAELVIQNKDCQENFFHLFMPGKETYSAKEFQETGYAVTWKLLTEGHTSRKVLLKGEDSKRLLEDAVDFNSILYGVRYWVLELGLIDEFFRLDRDAIMYPIIERGDETEEVVKEIQSLIEKGNEWTTFSILDLEVELCEKRRRIKENLFRAIRFIEQNYSGFLYLIPTSRNFATITARSKQREDMELRGYFKDSQGRIISHIRLHKSITEGKTCLIRC